MARSVYAKTRKECDGLLAELIEQMKAEITAEKACFNTVLIIKTISVLKAASIYLNNLRAPFSIETNYLLHFFMDHPQLNYPFS